MLKTNKTHIVDEKGNPVQLRGVNFGGWLMMEAYILHAPNYAEHLFKKKFAQVLGEDVLAEFECAFRDNFIQEEDFKNIKKLGFNCIRVPFNYRVVAPAMSGKDRGGLKYLDLAVEWAEKYGIWVILDLHAAPGSQNHDWHSDSDGRAKLWTHRSNQKKTLAVWEFVANRYKDCKSVAGYDLLNESVLEDTALLNKFYKEIIKTIRSVDKNHILFIEGNKWATNIACLDEFEDDNYVLSIHSYEPLHFTFHFEPGLRYPLKSLNYKCDRSTLAKHLKQYADIGRKRQVPLYNGEFGVHYREGFYGEDLWVLDMVSIMNDLGIHWTYWTYKAIKNSVFPDGLYSYYPNPVWVNRMGPVSGWDTFSRLWKEHKNAKALSWRTQEFKLNKEILNGLK
ncbi:MAG: glycoside hydrolase family 5 protein [Candidatus Omnitrophica bacterium]|nr:glycoside hydrolase family 5 protein [Candidatus Omnitrophota bacterium]